MQRKLQAAQDGLHSASEAHAAQASALAGRLRDTERALAEAQAEAQAGRNTTAGLQAAAADSGRQLSEQAGELKRLDAQRAAAEARYAALLEQMSGDQRVLKERADTAEALRGRLAAEVGALQGRLAAEVEALQGRLAAEADARQQAETAAAAAHDALSDEQKRRALDERTWERRLRELQQDAAERLATREAAWAAQQERAQREAATALEDLRRQLTKRVYLVEGEWAKKLQAAGGEWGEPGASAEAGVGRAYSRSLQGQHSGQHLH